MTQELSFRIAQESDIQTIADMHTLSWQRTYRGMYPQSYLDNDCANDRLQIWTTRLTTPLPNQHVIIADLDSRPVGFGCCYIDESPRYGTLIDNLHVMKEYQGQGIGAQLIQLNFAEAKRRGSLSGYYLWVLARSTKSINFYAYVGGREVERTMHKGPLNTEAEAIRMVWDPLPI